MVIGGGAIGREGPTIQIAGSVFRKVNELWKNIWPSISRKNMIMTGAAAGLAAAFNTPLGGIVFVVEELTKTHINYFKTAVFTAVIIAGLTAQSIYGPYLYFGFPIVKDLSSYIVFSVILVAVIAGLFGSGMSRLLLVILKWKANLKFNYQHILYLIFCSLTITSLAYFVNVGILGSGKDLMVQTLFSDDKYLPWYMPLLRIIGPMLSFTTGASAGIFAPGLSAGGTVGAVISGFFEFSPSDSNVLILAGMVAFLTGITRAPFTSAILVLEMTDRHSLILYLMLAGILANIVSVFISKHSLYDVLKHQYLHEVLHEESKEPPNPESEAPPEIKSDIVNEVSKPENEITKE
jgi:H+/Cl- antiporter ClcA